MPVSAQNHRLDHLGADLREPANDQFPVAPFIAPIKAGNHGNLCAWLAEARDDQRHGVDTRALVDALVEGYREAAP